MDLYVYNEQIQPLGICDTFISLIWIRRYSSAGAFELYVPATEMNVRLLQPFRYLYRKDVDEAMYISTVQEKNGADEGKTIIISGYSIDGLYRKRVLPKNVDTASVISTLSQCNDLGCSIILDESIDCGLESGTGFSETMTMEEYMRYVLSQYGYGFDMKLSISENCMRGRIYSGNDLSSKMIFSEDFDNLTNSVYEFSEEGCFNCIYGICNEAPAGTENAANLPEYCTDTDVTGLMRTEKVIAVDPVIKTGTRFISDGEGGGSYVKYTYVDRSATLALLKENCNAALSDYTENFTADVVAFDKYRTDFNVGDIVTVKNDLRGIRYTKRIEEVQETFDTSGITVTPTFGIPLKTIYDLIR